MAEWFNAAVLKTVEGAIPPRVRISASPPLKQKKALYGCFFVLNVDSGDKNSGKRVRLGGAGETEVSPHLRRRSDDALRRQSIASPPVKQKNALYGCFFIS